MRKLQTSIVVLCMMLAPIMLLEENSDLDSETTSSDQNSILEVENNPSPLAPPLPSTIKIWEAWAKGYAEIYQSTTARYTVMNNGPSNVIIDEYTMLMSPSPANPSEDQPYVDDETQDGALTTTYTVSPGNSFTFNYGDNLVPPLWWCTEETEFTNPNIYITLGGEIFPYEMIGMVQNPNSYTQEDLYFYMQSNPVLVIGKRPLWEQIANNGDVVDTTLEITNIGFQAATNVVVTDKILPGYSYDPSSFTKTPSQIITNPDGSITLKWTIPLINGAIETPINEPTDYPTEYIGYKLITPLLNADERIFLPRAYVDKNNDGTDDAESAKPLLETYLVNRPPVAIVDDVQIFEGETAYLDGSSSYDPDEPSGDYIVSYEWDFDGDGIPDKFGAMVSQEYGDDGVYSVTLTVTDTYGASSSTTATVTVVNKDPAISFLPINPIAEGGTAILQVEVTDPGSDDLTLIWEFESGPTITTTFFNDGIGPDPDMSPWGTYPFNVMDSAQNTYGDNGVYSVTLTATDDDSGSTVVNRQINVYNVAPSITLMIVPSGDEGFPITFFAESSDPGSDDLIFTWQFEYGPTITHTFFNDGIGPDPAKSPGGIFPFDVSDTAIHTYGDDYDYTLTLTVIDDDDGFISYSTKVKVNNTAPWIVEFMIPYVAYEGTSATYQAKVQDFGSDDLTFEWNFGDFTPIITNTYYNDGMGPDPKPSPEGTYPFIATDTLDHTYGDDFNYTLSLKVTDDDGDSTTFTTNVTVVNLPPIIEPFGPFYVDEGSPITLLANSQDPGSDDLTYEWEFELGPTFSSTYYNDGANPDPYPSPWGTFPFYTQDTVSHTYGDNYVYDITLTVTDDDGDADTYSTTITVNNTQPTIEPFGPFERYENIPLDVFASASDQGSDDLTFTWAFELGPILTNTYYNDGTGPDPLPSPEGTYPFFATDNVEHTYGDNGEYSLTLTVTDDDGDYDSFTTTITVYNVAPTIEPLGPFTVDEGSQLDLIATSSDPGSDDLTFTWELELGPTIMNIHYNDGIGPDPYPSPEINPMNVTDIANHIYGDNGIFTITLTVEDDDGDYDVFITNVTVKNVAPSVSLNGQYTIDENSPITINGYGTDPGSDDLTFTWEFEFGPIIVSTHYNDQLGPDPFPSPDINPMDITDLVTHTYGDDGEFEVILTVEDDDGDFAFASTEIIVDNIAPTIDRIEAFMYANFSIRIAGEKYHSVGLYIYEDDEEIFCAKVTRHPGNPDEQRGTISNVKVELGKSYTALVDYLPNDPRENGNVWGANPVWIDIEFEDGSVKRLHHTFNVRQSDWNSDHWNHIDPWEVELAPYFVGHNLTFEAQASDPGSDDLTFEWNFGDGNSCSNIHYNNELCPDPYPSPEINPMCCADTATHKYDTSGIFSVTLTVTDDDNGSCVETLTLTVG